MRNGNENPESLWKTARLSNVVDIDRVGVDPTRLKRDEPYVGLEHVNSSGRITNGPTVGSANLKSTKFKFTPDHILFGKLRPYLRKVARPENNGVCSTDILPLLPGKEIDRDFLFHWLRTDEVINRATSACAGANLPRLSPEKLRDFELYYPISLAEQKRIAAILDKADAIRRKLQQSLLLSDDFLRSVFFNMFGNPVFNPNVKTIVTVADAGEVQLGRQRAPKYQSGRHTCPYVRVANVYENRISTKDVLSMDFNTSDFKKYRLEEGDILLNEGQSTELVGRPAMWRNEIPNCCFQNTLVRFKAKKGVVEPYYALFVFLHYLWYGRFASLSSKTSSVAHLGAARFAEMPFPLPDLPSQQKFAKLAEKTYRSQVRLRAQVSEAEALFSSLQQRAFRGEL